MKSEVNPIIGGVVVIILLAVVGFFIWRGTSGSGGASNQAGGVGNASPFAPGGVANNRGAKPAQANSRPGGPPGANMGGPRSGGQGP